MTQEQINEQYKLASHWSQSILLRLDEAIIPLSAESTEHIIDNWRERMDKIMDAYTKLASKDPLDMEALEKLQVIAKIAMGNHRSALRLKGVIPAKAMKLIIVPSFPSIQPKAFQGFMPG